MSQILTQLIDVDWDIVSVYETEAMSEGNMRKLCQLFNEGKTNAHNEQDSCHPSLITKKLKGQIDEHIKHNWCFTLDTLLRHFQYCHSLLHNAVTVHLNCQKYVLNGFLRCCLKYIKNNRCLLFWVLVSKMSTIC